MPAQLRVVRRRIRSVQSTMKITRAQELIAASRLVRAQQRVAQSRPYTRELTTALSEIATTEGRLDHPLLEHRAEIRAAAVLVVTSDRGFAGPYNANVLRTTEELVARLREDGIEPRMYVIGRKGVSYYRFRQRPLVQSWTGISDLPRYEHAREVAGTLLGSFLEGEVDEIHAVFTDFVSAAVQRPVALRFIPLVVEEAGEAPPRAIPMYLFEPDPEAVLDALLPRYIAARVFTAMLESAASEQAARRRAMAAATDNAEELIQVLTRDYNQARQGAITQEIMEIVGGTEALQQSGS
jgi:F-type H+-transporting ATPase subunit gamma